MTDRTFYHADGTASRVCAHEGAWLNASGEHVCPTWGAATQHQTSKVAGR